MARPAFLVRRPGPLTSVQDLGRYGYQYEGVAPAGAADPFSLWVANRLVGNPPGEACLEVTSFGLEVEALGPVVVAIGGGDLDAAVEGHPATLWASFPMQPGQRLVFRALRQGFRAYLAVAGGVAVPSLLGSRSTDLLGHLGGLAGRPLRAGDVVMAAEPTGTTADLAGRRLDPARRPDWQQEVEVSSLVGPQADWFSQESVAIFFSGTYRVTPASDRMGLRLEGPAVVILPGQEMVSEGTPTGAVQVPGDGQPILLMAGRQTVGGYPKLAVAATPDLPVLAQLRPGQGRVRFRAITLAGAHHHLARYTSVLESPGLII